MINSPIYEFVLKLLDELNPDQLAHVERHVQARRQAQTGLSAIANHARDRNISRVCPRCGFAGAHRHGVDARGRQRFLCVRRKGGCGRTFNGLTGTPFARMRKPELWERFIRSMASGHQSIDDLHEFGGIGVARSTLWRWRMVVLRALSDPDPRPLSGVVEADETFFRESFKGSRDWKRGKPPAPRFPYRRGGANKPGSSYEQVPVITAVDRGGNKLERMVGYRDDVPDALLEGLENGTVLCTDGWQGFLRVARDSEASHVVIPSKAARRKSPEKHRKPQLDPEGGKLSLARVNALHTHLKSFVYSQARGVSTRHLQGYLDWTQSLRKPALEACQVILARRPQRQLVRSLALQRE